MNRHPFENQPRPSLWERTRVESVPEGCFADEVAIDFPAVDQLLERERATFLGEHPTSGALTTEITLSVSDARVGTVLPLEVPICCTCSQCGGRGETWTETCTVCGGSGSTRGSRPIRLAVPAGVADGARFRLRVACPDASSVLVEVRVFIRSSVA